MNANTSHKGTSCGCGGGATTPAAICSCGGGGCASCQGQGIMRPRFFAGQLLTEDDMQLLTDYSIQKNRLHNRYLFGAGVVCGLEVTCHPCGNGQVIVHPGYALDCCGNDLTLDCAQTLDINKMIGDLRRDQLGGFDCGDPCPDPPKADASSKVSTDKASLVQTAPGAERSAEGSASPEQPKTAPPRLYQYCLYIRYCEQPTDPVMPYSTGDDCGRQACEATRVREGIKFELRCKPEYGVANPLIARLCACLGDLNTLRRIAALVQQLKPKSANLAPTFSQTPGASFDAPGLATLKTKIEALDVTKLKTGTKATDRQAASGETGNAVNSRSAESLDLTPEFITNLGSVAGIVNQFDELPASRQIDLKNATPELEAALDQGREKIQLARAAIINDSRASFEQIQDWLIRRLDNTPYLTDCTLRQRVKAMAVPVLNPQSRNQEPIRSFVNANAELARAFFDFVRDCICRALNPSCEPCEDTGVLLACFEVQECIVVRVCNLERTFVLSPAAVRYWLPPLQLLGNLVERLCCDPLDSLFTTDREGRTRFNINKLLETEVEKILTDSLCNFKTDADWVGTMTSRVSNSFRSDASRAAPSASGAGAAETQTAAPSTSSPQSDAVTEQAQADSGGVETEGDAAGEVPESAEGENEIAPRRRTTRRPRAQS